MDTINRAGEVKYELDWKGKLVGRVSLLGLCMVEIDKLGGWVGGQNLKCDSSDRPRLVDGLGERT